MSNIAENNVIRFKTITQKKNGLFANFLVKGIRAGVSFTASFSVDISSLELHPGDTLEKIIEQSARLAMQEFKKANFRFEGMENLEQYLDVAQLG